MFRKELAQVREQMSLPLASSRLTTSSSKLLAMTGKKVNGLKGTDGYGHGFLVSVWYSVCLLTVKFVVDPNCLLDYRMTRIAYEIVTYN